jgi:4-hydroxy-2-oxoheptanedioate aldolase
MFPLQNRTKGKLADGGVVLGVFITVPAPRLVELCGIAGYDFVVIDAEHGPIDLGICEDMVRAAEVTGITAIVRVPDHQPKTLLRFLDLGAQGVMIPQLNSVSAAKAVIDAVKYAPLGSRGLGPGRAAAYGQRGALSDYAKYANSQTMIIGQLEHVDALKELDALVRLPEIDAFEIGLADLSQSLGYPGETSRPEVQQVAQQFVTAVLAAGSVIGDTANTPEAASSLINQGYRLLDCSFVNVATTRLKELKKDIDRLLPPPN